MTPITRILASVPFLAGTLALVLAPGTAHAQQVTGSEQTWERYRLDLDFHPIAPVVSKGRLRLSGPVPLVPGGFRADKYSLFPSPTYGLGGGWQVVGGVTAAERIGPGGNAIFYGLGVQKELLSEKEGRPTVSLGGYGMAGPHQQRSGRVYLVATHRVLGDGVRPEALYLHGGLKLETYSGDDYGKGTGLRPYGAASIAATRRVFFTGEIAPPQPWEETIQYSLRGTYMFRVKGRNIGISGGIRNNGYRTLPFIGLAF